MQPSLRYLIVDDDELDRLAVESQARAFPFLHKIAACSHPLEAFELINRFHPEIVFVDIEMPDISGLELITRLAGLVPAPVFITSHPEYALESYERQAFDYILKPLSTDRFARCATRLRDFFELRLKAFAFDARQETDSLVIKQGHEKHRISIPDILYLEAMKDYTRIQTTSGQYLVLTTLTGMIEQLPAGSFVRIHRSFVVNRHKVDAMKNNTIDVLAHELPIGKLYRNSLTGLFPKNG